MTPQLLMTNTDVDSVEGVPISELQLAHERLLSLSDLAAGALAVSTPTPYGAEGEFKAPDSPTAEIIHALSHFGSALEQGGPPGKLLVLVNQPAAPNDRLTVQGIALRRAV